MTTAAVSVHATPRSPRLFSPAFRAALRRLLELHGAACQVAGSRYL